MHPTRALALVGSASLALGLLFGCGGSSSGTKLPGGTVSLVVRAVNYGASRASDARALTASNTNNGAPNGVPGLGMLSGPPAGMRVYLQQIALTQSDGGSAVLFSSTASHTTDSGIPVTGCQIELTTGNIDLSVCTGLSSLTVPAGTYTGTTFTFAEVGEIKGCLNGKFNFSVSAAAGTYTYPAPFPQTVHNYVTDTVSSATTYTFCTRKDKHYFLAETASDTAIGSNSDFQASNGHFTALSAPEYVAIDLGAGNQQAKTVAELEAGSVTLSSATLPTSSDSTFTLSVDMNRMLEFFGNVRNDFNPPNPSWHTGTSYFFTTKFTPVGGTGATSAVSAYAGAVGSVQGYQWVATPTGGGQPAAAGWYTLFLDASGNYLGGSMYEDDDNELTILKGNAKVTSGDLTAGATLTMDIAGTCTGFKKAAAVNGTSTCSLTATGQGSSATYDVALTRLL